MIAYGNQIPKTRYYQMSTTNESFKNVHYILKEMGIKNNKFMLTLLDPDLAGVDPFDPRLNSTMCLKILRECQNNFWYFIREVVRVPASGGIGGGSKYELTRGNLALNYCMALNLNIFFELPRQQGKTMSALCRYLYLFNFGTTNSEIAFLNKRLDDSKLNLARLKELRSALPSYLQMAEMITPDNKRIKATNSVMALQHVGNNNKIKAVASATGKANAASVLRGRTIPLIYFDEFAFIPHNEVVYLNGVPAFKTAARIAKDNGAPYGMLITTTPGFLTEGEGKAAYEFKESATKFSELWYDMSYMQLMELVNANNASSFVYIKFTYQELGRSEEWFIDQCRDMKLKWPDIRREILLEWSAAPENCPFTQEQLDGIRELVRAPISQIMFLGKYIFNIYDRVDLKYPPIIGVDVSGGYKRDSSTIAVIDSRTTKLFAELNCNYIPPTDLSKVIYELVTTRMPNAVVNIERNGGFGASVLAQLVPTSIKKNLYYEIKDKVIEEVISSSNVHHKKTQRTKIFGLDSTKEIRDTLIQILRERVEYHKDKFVARVIYDELRGMECKRNGKIEHSSNTHDDSVFALLMALYVWYEGKDVMERYGIQKSTIKTDASLEEAVFSLEEKYTGIIDEMTITQETDEVSQQLAEMNKAKGKMFYEWAQEQVADDERAMQAILSTKVGKKAVSDQFNTPIEDLESAMFTIPDNVFNGFYDNSDE